MRRVDIEPTFESWQAAARALLREGVPPGEIAWGERAGETGVRGAIAAGAGGTSPIVRVPRRFLDLARAAATHRDPARWRLLYEVLWRITHEGGDLLESASDPQVRRLQGLAAGARRDALARETMETDRADPTGVSVAPFVPAGASLAQLRDAASRCTGCDLYRHATQTVFGEGAADARIVIVGEQPGDQEDRRGAPFVGPAGEVLDRALGEVGLDRDRLYVTNAVKHFKFVERGKRRIHQKPRLSEIMACRPWLEAELAAIRPEVLVCLGATAASAIFGADFRLMREHGRFLPTRWTAKTLATLHPSAVLRGEDEAAQARLYRLLVDDLRLVAAGA